MSRSAPAPLGWKDALLIAAVIGSFGLCIVKGLMPHENRHWDSDVFYVAGRSLLQGSSPYDLATADARWRAALGKPYDVDLPFMYPPTFLPWLAGTTWMPLKAWSLLLDGLHVASVGLLLWCLFGLSGRMFPCAGHRSRLLGLALAGAGTGLIFELRWGGVSFFVVVALAWAWRLLLDGRSGLALALLVGIASIKPQLSLVPALALMVGYGRPRQWLLGGVIAVAYCVAIGLVFGFSVYLEFARSLSLWPRSFFNHPDQVSGWMYLGAKMGLTLPPFFLLAVSAGIGALVAGLYRVLRWPKESPDERRSSLVLVILNVWIVNESLLPFHWYDHTIVMIPLALSVLFEPWTSRLLIPGLVLAARPSLVTRLVGPTPSMDLIITVALLFSAMAGVAALFWLKRAQTTALLVDQGVGFGEQA
jgi:hypothetical protein